MILFSIACTTDFSHTSLPVRDKGRPEQLVGQRQTLSAINLKDDFAALEISVGMPR
jgi:hypothetical protein